MTKNKGKLTVSIHIAGKEVETLTEEQAEKIVERFGKAMNLYYANHLDEFQKI